MRQRIFFLFFSLIISQFVKAQDSNINEVIAFHPFHLINNGIRIDYDRKLSDKQWLQISPQFYAAERTDNNDFRDYNELLGVGVSLFHRIYLSNQTSFGTYFSYGFTYSHFNLKYDEDNSGPVNTAETTIDKFGGDIVIGYQSVAFEKLVIDVYAGLGSRYSDRTYIGTIHRNFNKLMYDYGYTGNVLVAGIRIGFGF
jgi:hypothetical protein